MPRTRNPYPAEFREQIVALARIESLAREFEPCVASIHNQFNQDRHFCRREEFEESRSAVLAAWHQPAA